MHQIFCVPVRNKTGLTSTLSPQFTFYCKIFKINLDYSELQKVSLKAITMGIWSQSHDGIHFKILPTLLEVFLRHLSYCLGKAFNEGYDKINEFSSFKCNLVSRFNKFQDTVTELSSKDTFLRTWNSLLNYNWSLNMQFNYFLYVMSQSNS